MSAQSYAERDDRSDLERTDTELALEARVAELTDQRDRAVELLAAAHGAGYFTLPKGDVADELRTAVRRLIADVGPTELRRKHTARLRGVLAPSLVAKAAQNAVLHELLGR